MSFYNKDDYHVINKPIRVPKGKYCFDGNVVCGHFDNEGGHESCNQGFWGQKRDKEGNCLKDQECLSLEK